MDIIQKLFIDVLNMSITASYVAVAVIVVRLLLKKAPKIFSYTIWSVVLFRMVCPLTFSSVFSLLRFTKSDVAGTLSYVPQNIGLMASPSVDIGISSVNKVINGSLPQAVTYASINPMQIHMLLLSFIWVTGLGTLLLNSLITYCQLMGRIKTATLVRDNIYESENITTPFVGGFIKPRIYVPVGITEKEMMYIVKHEQIHVIRHDNLIKPIAYIALVIHWFNPLMWVSFVLMTKDMEMSCDESVMKSVGSEVKIDYSYSLLNLAVDKKIFNIGHLAFGESHVKARIKNVLKYKKPTLVVMAVSFILCVLIIITTASNPKEKQDLSLVSINTALLQISLKSSLIGIETEENIPLSFIATTEFFESFNKSQWVEKEEDFPYESTETLRINISDGYYISLYSNDDTALIYCSFSEDKYQYYSIPEGTYKAIKGVILTNANDTKYQYEKLLEYKTPYIGDNSKISALVGSMPLQEGMIGAGISLKTDEEPYGLTINYQAEIDPTVIDSNFYLSNSIMLFALIDNVSEITFKFASLNDLEWTQPDITFNKDYVDTIIGEDVRIYAKDSNSLKELVEIISAYFS